MSFLKILLSVCLLTVTSHIFAKGEEKKEVSVKVLWDYKGLPGKLEIYEPIYDGRIWEMANVDDLKDIPVKNKIETDTIKIKPGGHKTFILVYKNESKESLYFFAAPHVVEPPQFSLGFRFKCLCINHVFNVKPGKYWYRIVEMSLDDSYKGNSLDITHHLVKVSEPNKDAMIKSGYEALPSHAHQH